MTVLSESKGLMVTTTSLSSPGATATKQTSQINLEGMVFTVWSKETWVCLHVFKEKSGLEGLNAM